MARFESSFMREGIISVLIMQANWRCNIALILIVLQKALLILTTLSLISLTASYIPLDNQPTANILYNLDCYVLVTHATSLSE